MAQPLAWPAVDSPRTVDLQIVPSREAPEAPPDLASAIGLADLPGDWEIRDAVHLGGAWTDRVIVGPNGVFTVAYDPSPGHVAITDSGAYRTGSRLTTQVKAALATAFVVRRALDPLLQDVFPYPVLAVGGDVLDGWVGRLKVTSGAGLAEAVWRHPGRPLTRTERRIVLDAIDRRAI